MNPQSNQLPPSPVIGCGMYAFTDSLRNEWARFFGSCGIEDGDPAKSIKKDFRDAELSFSTSDSAYFSSRSLISHTCGFPYLKKWRESHQPVCVPIFAIDGCDGINYRSWFITNRKTGKKSLEDFYQSRVAINGWESNSGMNVLRYAISKLANGERFFNQVKVTGSHYRSMQSVASGEADIAAIDAVSFYFSAIETPELVDQIKVFEQSEVSVGLPFVQQRSSSLSPERITGILNSESQSQGESNTGSLRLSGFQAVSETAYLPMLKMERLAAEAGYQTLA